jgi:hypothetical protein
MTEEHKASRTIVKSPPELWAECSVAQSLARHLGEFGEIRITRLEPETTVAWEGEHASGTVRLEPSGWGTQVTLTATPIAAAVPEPAVEPEPEPEPEPVAVEFEHGPVVLELEPEPVAAEAQPDPLQEAADAEEAGDDHDERASEHLPRWQVFARLWGRLGRKSHHAEDESDDDESDDDEADEPEAAEEASEPVDDVEDHGEHVEAVPEPELVADSPEPEAVDDAPAPDSELDHQGVLVGALDSLGQAHHRPFSRA